jgi:hypothetical protein
LEAITLFGAVFYVFLSLKEIYHQGYKTFYQTLVRTFLLERRADSWSFYFSEILPYEGAFPHG